MEKAVQLEDEHNQDHAIKDVEQEESGGTKQGVKGQRNQGQYDGMLRDEAVPAHGKLTVQGVCRDIVRQQEVTILKQRIDHCTVIIGISLKKTLHRIRPGDDEGQIYEKQIEQKNVRPASFR